ncbi:DUF1622 domain-containing protein [uncultured Clostridium sp.]|uniref:DUF1622 domain-containing protein n=1 Tax=uncultured Clostridium sp. TaxID=59620 RepID=UPI0028EE472A|nr:DUF1622 domain-containing protein [uncultured Clostridium sp.]
MHLESFMGTFIPLVIHLLEAMGTFIIIFGAGKAFFQYIKAATKSEERLINPAIKIDLANALALALEFKLGGEILKTVVVRTLDEMYILASIVALRAILTFVIHWEIKSESKEHIEHIEHKEHIEIQD